MARTDPIHGGVFSARRILFAAVSGMGLWLLILPSTPAHAGLWAFLAGGAIWLRLISRGQLETVGVEREHLPRVFQGDPVTVTLRLSRGRGAPIPMLVFEDRFHAAIEVRQRHLVPLLVEGWAVRLHYERRAERHRGLYLVGPAELVAADPLGVFVERRTMDCISRLTIYPKALALPDYRVPGPMSAMGASMDFLPSFGTGEEILGVREYRRGDPPATVHWRSSARRGQLRVIQRNRPVQAEVAVMLDLTRAARYGLGAESTSEQAILLAVSVLTRAYETRHRLSLAYAHREAVRFEARVGLAHLHLLLDRLAVVNPAGAADFWGLAAERTLALPPGSRGVIIQIAALTPLESTLRLIREATARGVAIDMILIDEDDYIRIYRDQERDLARPELPFDLLAETLRRSGARIHPMRRGRVDLLNPFSGALGGMAMARSGDD
jgi:uncharacterized protein (DUF58 family)